MKMGCTIAQPIWYGSHPHNHLGMPGTIVVPEDVLLANMRAIITGLWNMGFRKQIFVNGHGQEEVLPLAIQQWQKKYQLPAVLITLHTWTVIHEHMKDKAHGEAIKAIGLKIALESNIEGTKPEEKITRMKAEIVKAPGEMQPGMGAILASGTGTTSCGIAIASCSAPRPSGRPVTM